MCTYISLCKNYLTVHIYLYEAMYTTTNVERHPWLLYKNRLRMYETRLIFFEPPNSNYIFNATDHRERYAAVILRLLWSLPWSLMHNLSIFETVWRILEPCGIYAIQRLSLNVIFISYVLVSFLK